MARRAILAIDEGTTNAKAVLVAQDGAILASGARPVPIAHPRPGWVEQDADAIWTATLGAVADCLAAAEGVDVVALGLSNQRESILMWDRRTGAPLGPVVSWQCRRTAAACEALRDAGHSDAVIARTGLPIDPMFPATKARWLLDAHAGDRAPGDVCLGTVDSWLIWRLTGGRVHATDASNAARTQLMAIADGRWDPDLCALFGAPLAALPEICDSAHVFGATVGVAGLPDGTPIASAIGDSHGALFGHGAFTPGDGKITFGTGSSVMTTMADFAPPPPGVTTTIAWSVGGRPTYALEGNILVSAAILPWTAALLGLPDVDALLERAASVDDALGVTLVPAHVGLGAPHWDTEARGLIAGLTFPAGPAHVARAAAESIAHQVGDVFDIMASAAGEGARRLFADGGPSRNGFLMGLVASRLDYPLTVCDSAEASARGAAYLAGLAVGFWPDMAAVAALERGGSEVRPAVDAAARAASMVGWRAAVARSTLRP